MPFAYVKIEDKNQATKIIYVHVRTHEKLNKSPQEIYHAWDGEKSFLFANNSKGIIVIISCDTHRYQHLFLFTYFKIFQLMTR